MAKRRKARGEARRAAAVPHRPAPVRPTTLPPGAAALFAAAVQHHQAGRLAEAEPFYRQVLAADPGHVDSLHNLGLLAQQTGRGDLALDLIARAVALRPDLAVLHYSLGGALKLQARLDHAVGAYRQAIVLRPDYAEAHYNLANALRDQGRADDAASAYREVVRLQPGHAWAHYSLGAIFQARGELDAAAAAYGQAIVAKPDLVWAHHNLGALLLGLGRLEEAVAAIGRAIALDPSHAEAHLNLGNALRDQDRLDEAVLSYRRALTLKPDLAEAYSNLGAALRGRGELEAAVEACRRALELSPDLAWTHGNLAVTLFDQGRFDEAATHYRRAMELAPDLPEPHSNWLYSLLYRSDQEPDALLTEHRRWGERHGGAPAPAAHANDRDPERRLRVGYVSPDLRAHSVAWFLEPLLRAHDRSAVEVFAYAEVAHPDAVTQRLRALSDHWRSTVGVADEDVAEMIRADGIDILIDLAGHTAGARLPVFARRPSPVQATWLGYPGTTGLAAMNYRLVDAITDPPGNADVLATETLVRLEGGFLAYAPPADAPDVTSPPSAASGVVTFGSFNNPAKLSDETVRVWAALLTRLPAARLLLKARPFTDAAAREVLAARFAAHGVGAERLDLRPWTPGTGHHLAAYGEVDIALDPFPYNGTTTTCEALWMGVPVIVLSGDRHAGRVGASLLTRVGLQDLIAENADRYVEIAAALARDPARLASLRSGMRVRVAASPLCDAPAFARGFEAALRAMWRRWTSAQ